MTTLAGDVADGKVAPNSEATLRRHAKGDDGVLTPWNAAVAVR